MSDPARSIAAIYERYHQSLYRFCYSIVGNAEDAQDALQNAMLKAVRALPGEQREIQLKPWLYRIAHNESIEILRKRREEAPIDPELVASSAGPDEAAAMRERLQRLLADLSELPERQRGALVMRELAGLGFGEIGEALGTSEAVARQTVYEARLGLQQLEAGREMSCESVMRQISDADGRTMRRRDIRAHLRACPECRRFRDAIDGRSRDLAAIAPLPIAASAGILHALLGSAGGGHAAAGAGAASTIGAGAGKAVATSAVLKSAATVAVVAALGAGAADRSGVIDVGLPGGRAGGVTSSDTSDTTSSDGSDAAAGDGSAATTTAAGSAVAAGRAAGRQGISGIAPAGHKGRADGEGNGAGGRGGPQAAGEHGQAATGDLPAASQHGQETAADHKATPNSSSTADHGHSAAARHHSGRKGHGRSRSHGARHAHHPVR
ncbi:MAG TPA: sigma-70 family RNA polymerase sigma factor, partial [Solirubrobacterales bacterium]|nr:sigma-70 family RNA polymerase sigma factor [Solirubrobacterales bacterium]